MKPLLATQFDEFLKRFDFCKDGEVQNVTIKSPSEISIKLTTQDSAKDFDWISITLEFSGVIDASLVDSSKLHLLDMGDGISLEKNKTDFIFKINNSTLFIKFSTLKFKEGLF